MNWLWSVLVFSLTVSCAAPGPELDTAEPWTTTAAEAPEAPRILIIHDMEGLAGQDDPRSFDFTYDQYAQGQELLAGDINAVVEGLFAGGASEVLIADGHGSGNDAPDLRSDLLDPRAQQILRTEEFDTYFDLPESEDIDAVVVVGMHAKAGSGGFASHTFTLGIILEINGRSITETELVALSWGRVGVPVIFASGDDRLRDDLETMPWLEYVVVKEAAAADSARLVPLEEARANLTSGAQRAVEDLAKARVMRVSTPVDVTMRVVPPASLHFLDGIPGIPYEDGALSFDAPDMRSAYDGFVAAVGLATLGYVWILDEAISARPDGSDIFADYTGLLNRRWFDQESGRITNEDSESTDSALYHGYR